MKKVLTVLSLALTMAGVTYAQETEEKKPRWVGNASVGATSQNGNTDRLTAAAGIDAKREVKKDRITLKFRHNYAEDEDVLTTRNNYGSAKYDRFVSKRWYAFLSEELLGDKFKDLKMRSTTSIGVGHKLLQGKKHTLDVELGISYIDDDFIVAVDDSEVAARLGADYKWVINDAVYFTNNLLLYPSLEDSGEYKARNEAALLNAMSKSWSMKLSNVVSYDSDPAAGIKKSDITWIFGLQYSFK